MSNKDNLYELIVKDLASGISEGEKFNLEEELNSSFNSEKEYSIIKFFWNKYFPKEKPNNIITRTEKKLGLTYGPTKGTNLHLFLKIAASVLFVISLAYSSYTFFKPKLQVQLKEYSCGTNEIKEITLSDGTRVWLNSKSLLIATEPFTGETREVKLYGEGYFEVSHNPDQPFIVHTQGLKTRVLGTHFNIVAYPGDEIHEVILHVGKVCLNSGSAESSNVLLNPGHKAYFTMETGKLNVIQTDLGKPAKWRDGVLRFYDEELFHIAKKLERKFQTKIFIADSIVGNLNFTAEFDVEPLDRILTLLSEAKNFDFKHTERGVIIQHTKK